MNKKDSDLFDFISKKAKENYVKANKAKWYDLSSRKYLIRASYYVSIMRRMNKDLMEGTDCRGTVSLSKEAHKVLHHFKGGWE